MRSLTPLQRAVVTVTAVLAWGGLCFGAALAQPDVLTIQHDPPTRVPERHTSTMTPRPVSADAQATPAPHRRSQRLTTTPEVEEIAQ